MPNPPLPIDCAVEDILPPTFRQPAGRTDVYMSGGAGEEHGLFGQGDLLLMQAAGAPVPALRSAQDILSDQSLEDVPADAREGDTATETCYALLGLEFEHAVVELGEGAIAPQLAAAIRAEATDLIFWYQNESFSALEIHGRPIRRCIGYRCRRLHSHLAGIAVFVDARSLGLPVCCRWMRQARLTQFDFGGALGLTLPGGFRLRLRGGDPLPHEDDVRHFEHCGSAVLWVESLMVHRAPQMGR